MKESTRFKLALACLGLYFIQGILKTILDGFPIVEILAAEGAVVAYYFTVRSVTDTKQMKYGSTNADPK